VGVCVVIPAYNSEKTIEAVVRETLQQGFPLLVVDDGSGDATAKKIAGLPINIVRHNSNKGKGMALRTAFDWALAHGFSTVVTLDSDGQHDPTAIHSMVELAKAKGFDLLLASRYRQFQEMAGLRRHWNCFGAWCMRKRTGFGIDDSQSGFRVYSSRLLRSVSLECEGYDMEMEILVKCWKAGFSIGSVPVAARVADGRSTSHFRPVRDTWRICMTFLKYSIPSESSNAAKP
jgi:glycosyltransferase involved in cell wall biosynthesis